MRVAVHSDLHLEGNRLPENFLSEKDFDVVVLAGDIVTSRTVILLADVVEHANGKPVIYFPGNHEYYGSSIDVTRKKLAAMCEVTGIIYADRVVTRIDGVNFVCATGWSDLESFDEFSMRDKTTECSSISDFYTIRDHSVENMVAMAKADRNFIETSLKILKQEQPNEKIVVATHFAPTEAHGNRRFAPSPISAYFSNKWEDVMYEHQPDYWIFGHTHDSVERDVYHTKVKSNQRGYGRECEGFYNPNYVFEV